MLITEIAEYFNLEASEVEKILMVAGFNFDAGSATGTVEIEGKSYTADEYIEKVKKTAGEQGVTIAQLLNLKASESAKTSKALAPTTEKKPAKRGRKAKQSQIEVAAEKFQSSNADLQREAVEAGISTGIQLANIYSASTQHGFLSKVAQNNEQLASVLGGEINRIHQETEDLIDVEAVYTQLEGNEDTPVLTQLFGS